MSKKHLKIKKYKGYKAIYLYKDCSLAYGPKAILRTGSENDDIRIAIVEVANR